LFERPWPPVFELSVVSLISVSAAAAVPTTSPVVAAGVMASTASENTSFALAKTPFEAGLRLDVFRVEDGRLAVTPVFLVVPPVFVDVFVFALDGLEAEVFFAGVFFLGAAAFFVVAFFGVAFLVVAFFGDAFLVVVDFLVVGFRFVVGISMLLIFRCDRPGSRCHALTSVA
jgi:hypothetical protein